MLLAKHALLATKKSDFINYTAIHLKTVTASRGQSHPLLAPLMAAIFALGLFLVPIIHSAATSSPNIPLFDPSHFTAEQLATSTLHDGIPDVWKIYYGLSTDDSTLANTDYTGSGIMNAEKYLLNIYPLAPAELPPLVTPPKATAKAATPAVKSPSAESAPSPSIESKDFSGYSGPLTHRRTKEQGGYPLGFFYGWVPKIGGWSAYTGSGVEVWRPYNEVKIGLFTLPIPDGEQFIELNARTGDNGIKQKITNARTGAYILSWRDMGRQDPKALSSPYMLHVFAKTTDDDKGPNAGKLENGIELTTPIEYNGPAKWKDELLAFTVPEDVYKTHPNIWIAFIPTHTNATYGALIDKINLTTIEVEQPLLSDAGEAVFDTSGKLIYRSVSKIRLTRWIKAFSEDQRSKFFGLDDDSDSVRFKISGIKDGPQLKIGTKEIVGSASGNTKDGPCTMGANRKDASSDVWKSCPFSLVADEDDDKTYNRDGTDNGNDDGTYLASLGAKVTLEITLPFGGNANIEFPIAGRTATINLKMHQLSKDGVVDPAITQQMHNDVDSANRIYAPWGMQFVIDSIDGMALPMTITKLYADGVLDDAIWDSDHYRPPSGAEKSELRLVIESLPMTLEATEIPIYYVKSRIWVPSSKSKNGQWRDKFANGATIQGQSTDSWGGLVVMPIPDDKIYALPHEVGHALGLEHVKNALGVDIVEKHRIMSMAIPTWKNNYTDAKRLSTEEFKTIKKSHFYVPVN